VCIFFVGEADGTIEVIVITMSLLRKVTDLAIHRQEAVLKSLFNLPQSLRKGFIKKYIAFLKLL
jgi:hypothetical protein